MTVQFFEGRHNLDRRALALIEAANAGTDDELLDTPQTAVWLGVSPQWLEIGRSRRWGPPFCQVEHSAHSLSSRRSKEMAGGARAQINCGLRRSDARADRP